MLFLTNYHDSPVAWLLVRNCDDDDDEDDDVYALCERLFVDERQQW